MAIDGTCKAGDEPLTNEGWLRQQPEECYFYPMRDCPGWNAGGTCSRIGRKIPPKTLDVQPGDML